VRCPSCGLENPTGMPFCGACGASLQARCPQCGSDNPPPFKFCGACSTLLTGPSLTPQPYQADRDHLHSASHGAREGERRQLTVLFCDLVDSTALAGQLDPEDLRDVIRAYQDACGAVVHRFEGHIAQYLGDGLVVYFGYPQAHENDAQRAVQAGLGMAEGIGKLHARFDQQWGVRLAVRLGIHSGVVVVGDMGGGARHEPLALGETPNLAARLQGLAEPDTVVISGATYRLIRGLFECRDLGPHTLKGVSTPIPVYRVLCETGAQSRLEAAGATGLTPLVGREQEVGLLLARWAQVKEGLGQVVVLSGEAGIGKSRLVQVLNAHLAGAPHARLEWRGSPYGTGDATGCAGTTRRGGAPVPAGRAAAGDLSLQARPHPGHSLSVLAEEDPAAVPSAHCPGVGGAVSRHRRDAA
jgi:class 3 adenylate cyclase